MAKKFIDYTIEGVKVPGATTFLSVLDKPGLRFWYLSCGQKGISPKQVMQEASEYGDSVHKAIDCVLRGQSLNKSHPRYEEVQNYFAVTRGWKYLGGEFRVYSRYGAVNPEQPTKEEIETHMFAGTIDQLYEIDGKPVLVDVKTSNNVYPEYTLQLAAYMMGVPEKNPDMIDSYIQIERALILHLDKETKHWEILDRTPSDQEFEAVMAARHLYNWTKSRGSNA